MLASPKLTDLPSSAAMLDGEDPMVRGVFEPPSGSVLVAIGRHKLLILVCTVVVALIGVSYGLSYPRTYMASATLQVGQVNPNSPGFFSYVQSASALATAFSRAIDAEPVLATIQQKLKLAPTVAIARLSAEPIPVSPAFRVIATGPTSSKAIQLANVTAGAVIAYESQSNSANPEAASLLHDYGEASFQLHQATATLARLSQDKGASLEARAHAAAHKAAAVVRLRAIGNSYVAAVTSQAPRSGLVSLLAGATSASSDHRSKVETYGFIGLLAGFVFGCLAAVLRERTRVARKPAEGGEMKGSSSV
jgi:hypothetical protein